MAIFGMGCLTMTQGTRIGRTDLASYSATLKRIGHCRISRNPKVTQTTSLTEDPKYTTTILYLLGVVLLGKTDLSLPSLTSIVLRPSMDQIAAFRHEVSWLAQRSSFLRPAINDAAESQSSAKEIFTNLMKFWVAYADIDAYRLDAAKHVTE
eukprot:673633-Amphidinium_carterae.1